MCARKVDVRKKGVMETAIIQQLWERANVPVCRARRIGKRQSDGERERFGVWVRGEWEEM